MEIGRPIRVGVVGVGRGLAFARGAGPHLGLELVALCDQWEEKLAEAGERFGVSTYTEYGEFLRHDMDAVVLANYFHEHAPFAIKALRAGKHVMSETAACKTLAEGVALCREVEQSGLTYLFAENYPYSAANQEMRRLYRAGEIGDIRYAEGEYNHPGRLEWRLSISVGQDHWRNWMPPTYYCSHALGPLMVITGEMPVSVNALSIAEPSTQSPNTVRRGDAGMVILVRTDSGAVFRLFGLVLSSIHRVRYELHGSRGLLATAGPNHWSNVRVYHEDWLRESGQPHDMTYTADWPEHGDLARRSGHGGGDFWTNFYFAQAIRSGEQPYLNVYRGAAMAAVGILGWRSCLEDGAPYQIPDFSDEASRQLIEDDEWSPFPEDAGPGQPVPSIRGLLEPSDEAVREARRVWGEL